MLTTLVGPEYDIVGFDPRGVGASVPSASCFDATERRIFLASDKHVLESKEDVAYALARDQIVAHQCASKLAGTGNQTEGGSLEEWGGGHYMDTGSVANDMLRITQAFGQEKVNYIGVVGFSSSTASTC
jgi:pimeloyl-ACP methyl ester carboxylesterase